MSDQFTNDPKVQLWTIENDELVAKVTNYGATLVSLKFQGVELVLGFDKLEKYQRLENPYFGATIGRVGNRIAKAEFQLNNRKYQVPKNLGDLCLHGGINNFSRKVWTTVEQLPHLVRFELLSVDGDEGFPGTLRTFVEYKVTKGNCLEIGYKAYLEPDQQVDTIVNLTNHTYFNLNGADSGKDVLNHLLQVPCQVSVLKLDPDLVPNGQTLDLDQNPLIDFRSQSRPLGDGIRADSNLYDCNLVITKVAETFPISGNKEPIQAAILSSPTTGISMKMSTTEPGFQLYTGNHISVDQFTAYHGVCLEAQRFPNACNIPKWSSQSLLKSKGQVYLQKTVYSFERKTV